MITIQTLSQLAEFINNCEDYPTFKVEEICERNGWSSHLDDFHVANNDTDKVIINDNGQAVVVPCK